MSEIIKDSVELGALIRKRRKELKVTQKDLALICGAGLRFIIELEKGKATCQTEKMLKVLSALGLTVTVLPEDTDLGLNEA